MEKNKSQTVKRLQTCRSVRSTRFICVKLTNILHFYIGVISCSPVFFHACVCTHTFPWYKCTMWKRVFFQLNLFLLLNFSLLFMYCVWKLYTNFIINKQSNSNAFKWKFSYTLFCSFTIKSSGSKCMLAHQLYFWKEKQYSKNLLLAFYQRKWKTLKVLALNPYFLQINIKMPSFFFGYKFMQSKKAKIMNIEEIKNVQIFIECSSRCVWFRGY